MASLLLSVKASLDVHIKALAAQVDPNAEFFELDDTVNTASKMSSKKQAIVWQFITMDEDPADPMYRLVFAVGAKTTVDPNNYILLNLVDKVSDAYKAGKTLDVMNYGDTGGGAPVKQGVIVFTDTAVDPQQFDSASSIRLVTVQAKVLSLL